MRHLRSTTSTRWSRVTGRLENGTQGSWRRHRVNWDDYNAETAAKNVMIFNCASEKLRKKAIAENLSYNDFVKTALAMENSETKTKSMAAGEGIRSITTEEEVRKLMSVLLQREAKYSHEIRRSEQESARLKERLLRETKLTLDKTVKICLASETAHNQLKMLNINDNSDKNVDAIATASG